MFNPRPNQMKVIQFEKGRMGILAVPGSGKTHTLSFLAANLVYKGLVNDDQEVLIVTLVNSAVDNFSKRVAGFIKEFGLMPKIGYCVRTLHGLAHDIVKERPQLVGLDDQFQIADERESNEIISNISHSWLKDHPVFINEFKNLAISNHNNSKMRGYWDYLTVNIATSFIKQVKDMEFSPETLAVKLEKQRFPHPLIDLGYEVFTEYQRILNSRGVVDFEDLIRLALQALKSDPDFLHRLQKRWPYILEDEAQDSSALQEKILRLLTGKENSWVRVGDPNQAIYETFTTANPRFLRNFVLENGVIACSMPNSGRSTPSIVNLANQLILWTNQLHPINEIRDALNPPMIELTTLDDPQPNPIDNPNAVYIHKAPLTAEGEIQLITKSVKKWLKDHPDQTVSILVPRNDRGVEMANSLRAAKVECIEMLQSNHSTRQTAKTLYSILKFFADPSKSSSLAEMFRNIYSLKFNEGDQIDGLKKALRELQRMTQLEKIVAPNEKKDWLKLFKDEPLPEWTIDLLDDFHKRLQSWQHAVLLSIDQFILILSTSLFEEPSDLALSYKLAMLLERAKKLNPDWGLVEFANELEGISTNRIRLIGFSGDEIDFDPDQYKGKVVVSTYHKSKGLEWDRVYLLSVNNYDFPSAQDYDQYISERWFVRDSLNLEAETLDALKSLMHDNGEENNIDEGIASRRARVDYCSERLRLLYVGITRARKELVITWNSGRGEKCVAALPLKGLIDYWENFHVNPN